MHVFTSIFAHVNRLAGDYRDSYGLVSEKRVLTLAIHFEGIAGSGKTTASERLCEILKNKDVEAAWRLEESADHPIMPKERRALSSDSNFSEVCLDAWQSFLGSQTTAVSILDGYAFQITVRFVFEQRAHRHRIDDYFERWKSIACAK